VTVHAPAPPVGSVEASAFPALSNDTHTPPPGEHVMPAVYPPDGSVSTGLLLAHARGGPVGFLELTIRAAKSIPTHSLAVGHDMSPTVYVRLALPSGYVRQNADDGAGAPSIAASTSTSTPARAAHQRAARGPTARNGFSLQPAHQPPLACVLGALRITA